MNRDKVLLDLELRLLVARHGKTRIANILSTIENVDLAAIDDGLKAYEARTKKTGARHRPKKSIEEMIRKAAPAPSTASTVERLAQAYDKKEFLPEFRDVKRFLESRRVPTAKFRSRSDAFPVVLRVLARHSLDELKTLDEGRLAAGSDLGIIADEILGSRE